MSHHHRSSLKQNQKSFKSKHASKSSLKAKNKGKIEKSGPGPQKPHVASKLERRNKAKQLMLTKKSELILSRKLFDGRKGAPRVVAVIPLCPDVEADLIVRNLNASLGITTDVPYSGVFTVPIDRFNQKIQYILTPRHMTSMLNAAQAADFVVFGLSAKQEVDHFGETCLRSIVAQGVSTVYTVVQHLEQVESARMQTEVRKSLLSFITHFFAEQEKVFSIEAQQDCLNVVRALAQQFPKGVQWRDSRAYLVADRAWYEEDAAQPTGGLIAVEGVVRGKKMNPDRLVHLPGAGDFQIDRICSVATGASVENSMQLDNGDGAFSGNFVAYPTEDQDSTDPFVQEVARGEDDDTMLHEMPEISEGVKLDDHFYLHDEGEDEIETPTLKDKNRIPRGMSEYQARWIIEENSDDEFDDGEGSGAESDGEMELDEHDGYAPTATDYAATEIDAQSEMFVDLSPEEEAKQLKAYREREREELEFPDEVELSPEMSAKERFARYRGLRNLRTSPWDADETDARTPEDWNRLARFQNFRASRNRALKEAGANGVPTGTRVIMYIRAPKHSYDALSTKSLLTVFSLLRYENKKVVLNLSVTPNTEYEEPIPTKDSLILQCGPRRYRVNPIFSETGRTPNHVYKLERFLHQGVTAMASVIAPVSFGNTPVLLLKETDKGIELVASGSVENADSSRVMAKRTVLSGYPYKIHKKLVTIRYMFFNAEDIAWFKAVPLFTKMGRLGYIKESIGTHGYFKCTFNGPINAQDTVAMALYKRVWPRDSELWDGAY
ncbi:hypothetical protein BZA70DRAFT_279906 [Myxozyma melibiosi]|uniref:Bms1-type G domain-containing protein n=1 Tax=Myxozyma melibiosi TaxID=54550 RepID=A0ABR1F4I0_9ASCO